MVYDHYGNNDRRIRKVTVKYFKSQASVFPNGKAGAFALLLTTIIMASLPSIMQGKAPETVTDEDIEWIGLVIKDLEDNKKSSPGGEE